MRLVLIAAACVAATVWSVPRAGAAQGGAAPSERVRSGQIELSQVPQPGSSVRRGRAVGLVDAPAHEVLAVIENYGGYRAFMPHFEKSTVLSQRGASALVYVQVSILHGASSVWAQLKLKAKQSASNGTTRVIRGEMMKGNVSDFEARWEVTPYGDKQTLVAFELYVDPDLPLPSSAISNELERSARKTIRALRRAMALPLAKRPAKKG